MAKEKKFSVTYYRDQYERNNARTFELIMKAKGNEMKNGEWYQAYVDTFENPEQAENYTFFNIKCRSLFNTQKLLRKKGSGPKNTREDFISLNGRVNPKLSNGTKIIPSVAPVKKDMKPKVEPKNGSIS